MPVSSFLFLFSLVRALSFPPALPLFFFLSVCPPVPYPSLALHPVPFPPGSLRQLLSRHHCRPSLQAKTGVS